MSLASWKREFYRTPANRVSKGYALRHSLKKWTGLLSRNRRKHKVHLHQGDLFDNKSYESFGIDAESCALCYHYAGNSCVNCPLGSCGDAFEVMLIENRVVQMINLLKKAMEKQAVKT